VLVFEQGSWRKDRGLFEAIRASSFANLVLAPGLKDSLRDDIGQFFSRREVYARYGVPWKRGVLLVGPAGNGKTHAVKALCQQFDVPALYVRSLEPQGMFHGSEHANISSVFDFARKTAPCLLILEDLDALLKPDNRSLILNELDGFASNSGICVVATSNYLND
jgi:SpoVK/Ycf46/Vps4 family AAA+-type ATPase